MLKAILGGDKESSAIMIDDGMFQFADGLCIGILKSYVQQNMKIFCICSLRRPQYYKKHIKSDNITYMDFYKGPLMNINSDEALLLENISDGIENIEETIIYIDNVISFYMINGFNILINSINKLALKCKKLIFRLNVDNLLGKSEGMKLLSLVNTCIIVEDCIVSNDNVTIKICLLHNKSNCRIECCQQEMVTLDLEQNVVSSAAISETKASVLKEIINKLTTPNTLRHPNSSSMGTTAETCIAQTEEEPDDDSEL